MQEVLFPVIGFVALIGAVAVSVITMQERLDFLERALLAEKSQSGRELSPGERQP